MVGGVERDDDPAALARLLGVAPRPSGRGMGGVPALSPLLPVAPTAGSRLSSRPAPAAHPGTTVRPELVLGPAVGPHPPAPPPRRATVVACFSPKGGVGKTTVSLMLAAALAQRGRHVDGERVRTCVVDLDLFGDVGARLGRASPTILDLARTAPSLTSEEVGAALVVDVATGLRALLAPPVADPRVRSLLTPGFHRRVVDALAACHDVVLLDCGTELTDPLVATFAVPAADRLLLVVNNEIATLAAARAALDLLTGPRIGFDLERVAVVLNQRAVGVGIDDGDVLSRLAPVRRIAARFPDDRLLFVGSANRGRPIVASADPVVEAGILDLVRAAVPGVRLEQVDHPAPSPGRHSQPASFQARHLRPVPSSDVRTFLRLFADRWLHRVAG